MFGDEEDKRAAGLPAANAWVWTFGELLAWLKYHRAVIELVNGSPSVSFPSQIPDDERAKGIGQMRRMRAELISHYLDPAPAAKPARNCDRMPLKSTTDAETGELAGQKRKRILSEIREQGAATRKSVLYLLRDGRTVTDAHPARKCSVRMSDNTFRKFAIPVDREATHVCVVGGQWIELPKVTSHLEDAAIAPKNRKKKPG